MQSKSRKFICNVPGNILYSNGDFNVCIGAELRKSNMLVTEMDELGVSDGVRDDNYDNFMADVWVGVVLTLMVLSCVCCVCSCLLYHKFQQWKRRVLEGRGPVVGECTEATPSDIESLPSYTIVSGLPTYEEALEQLRQAREHRASIKLSSAPDVQPTQPMLKLSVSEFFQLYKSYPPM